MSQFFVKDSSANIVNKRMGSKTEPRLAQLMSSLTQHLHDFVKENNVSETEWQTAITFLTKTGQKCSDDRQEFILLSDVLGLSMLVDSVQNLRSPNATPSTVFGPFHVEGSPYCDMGYNISLDGKGESCLFQGRVLDVEGAPVPDATLDVWSDNADGYYDVQQPNQQPQWNNRGVFNTGVDGSYWFRGIKPVPYPIPTDGPVGELLTTLDRSPWRPAHIHFIVSASGFESVTTHIFVEGDPYLETDAVFGVKEALIVPFIGADKMSPEALSSDENSLDISENGILWNASYDFILQKAK